MGVVIEEDGKTEEEFISDFENTFDLEWAFFTLKGLKGTIKAFGSTGTTMTNLSKGKFAGLKVLCPQEAERMAFGELVKPIFEQIQRLHQTISCLSESKNVLLPRLISGKLSVADLDIQFPPSMQDQEA